MSEAQRHLKWAVYVATLALGSFGCAPNATPAASFSPSASVIAYSPEPPQPSPTPPPSVPAPLEASLRLCTRGGYVDVTAVIVNHRSDISGPVQFYVDSWDGGLIKLGRNTTKWFQIDDYRWTRLNVWARIQGNAIPPGSKVTYSFTVIGMRAGLGVIGGVDVHVGDGEDGYTTDALYPKYVVTC